MLYRHGRKELPADYRLEKTPRGYDLDYVRDIELTRERISNRAAKQTEVMHPSAWQKCIYILYAIPG